MHINKSERKLLPMSRIAPGRMDRRVPVNAGSQQNHRYRRKGEYEEQGRRKKNIDEMMWVTPYLHTHFTSRIVTSGYRLAPETW